MAFKVKTKLNHSPEWYEEHCRSEDGSPSLRAMLTNDMKRIGADIDSTLHTVEKIPTYKEQWDAVIHGDGPKGAEKVGNGVLQGEIVDVLEHEAGAGFKPSEQFKQEPFTAIDDLMTEHDLNENTIREFLAWRSRRGAVAKKKNKVVADGNSKLAAFQSLKNKRRNSNPFFD